jgi:hypothetical protein
MAASDPLRTFDTEVIVIPMSGQAESGGTLRKWSPRLVCLLSLLALALLILACFGVYQILASGGALDAKRCAENGGHWDDGIEVCHFD